MLLYVAHFLQSSNHARETTTYRHESSSFAMEIYDDDTNAVASETFQTFLERTFEKKNLSFLCLRTVRTIYTLYVFIFKGKRVTVFSRHSKRAHIFLFFA